MKTRRLETRTRSRTGDEVGRGAKRLPGWPSVLFDDARATAVVTTKAENPELVEELGRLRSLSFAEDAGTTMEVYGLDAYDDYYKQLVVFDKTDGTIAAGTRLGLGDEIVKRRGWEALYTARYWTFGDGMTDVARRGVEVGRTWVHPRQRKRLRGLALLWKALALLLDGWDHAYFFGVVSLTGYPEESKRLIMNYLRCYHRSDKDLAAPRHLTTPEDYDRYVAEHEGLCADRAARELKPALERVAPEYPIPVLLRHYIRFGTELAGEFAASPRGNKVSALLLAPNARLREPIARFKSL